VIFYYPIELISMHSQLLKELKQSLKEVNCPRSLHEIYFFLKGALLPVRDKNSFNWCVAALIKSKKIARNDPRPCGSGKTYTQFEVSAINLQTIVHLALKKTKSSACPARFIAV
jgi:hypothetical protein